MIGDKLGRKTKTKIKTTVLDINAALTLVYF